MCHLYLKRVEKLKYAYVRISSNYIASLSLLLSFIQQSVDIKSWIYYFQVWRIDGNAKTPIPKQDIGKFHSGDCYIILYTYHAGDKKEYYLCSWIGKDSVQDDQMTATHLASTMANSLKGGRPCQGGVSSGYKNFISDHGQNDKSYTADGVALLQISGTSPHNNKIVQVVAYSGRIEQKCLE